MTKFANYMDYLTDPQNYIYRGETEEELIDALNIQSDAPYWTQNAANKYKELEPTYGHIIVLSEYSDSWLRGHSFFYGWTVVLPKNKEDVLDARHELENDEVDRVLHVSTTSTMVLALILIAVSIVFDRSIIAAVELFLLGISGHLFSRTIRSGRNRRYAAAREKLLAETKKPAAPAPARAKTDTPAKK